LAGKDNYASLNLADIKADANRYQLIGKLFNLSEETPTHSLVDSSLFKNLVSGGETIVKMLYKQPFMVSNRTKLILSCNELPKSKDTTHALFRRLIIVPFSATFQGATRDRDIKAKLLSELPGIFNLVIEGYKRLRRQRGFTESSVIRGELKSYQESVDPLVTWFNDFVVVEPPSGPSYTTSKRLYDSYKFTVEARGERPVTFDLFGKQIKKRVSDADERYKYFKVDGRTTRGYFGLKLIEENNV
jgi:putative DNA primase/helicase